MVRILFSLVFFLLATAIVPGFAAPLPSGNRRGPVNSWDEMLQAPVKPKDDNNPPRTPPPSPPPPKAKLDSKNHAESSGSAQPPTKPSGSGSAHPGHPTLPSGSGTHNVPEHHPTLTPPSGSGTHPPTQPSGSANTPKTSKNAAKKLWGVMKSKFKRGGGAGSASG